MPTSVRGNNNVAPTPFTQIPFILTLRQAQDAVSKAYRRMPQEGTAAQSPLAKRPPGHLRHLGFTLLELLVVISIIAIASAGVTFALRDSAQTALEREGERLAALLEAGRALSRTGGQTLVWRTTSSGFSFDGPNAANLPKTWLGPRVDVRWEASNPRQALVLGPEPIIAPQSVTLIRDGRALRIGSDGLHPFTILSGA